MPQESNQSPKQNQQSLLTKKSLALSLSAPRAPPHASAHRHILLGKDPSKAEWVLPGYRVKELKSNNKDEKDCSSRAAHSFYPHDTVRQRLHERFLRLRQHGDALRHCRRHIHPHLPTGPELGDQITRTLGLWLPHEWTHKLRDEGYFRSICDGLMTAMVPLLGALDPQSAAAFVRLSVSCQRFVYGTVVPEQQYVDVFLPDKRPSSPLSRLVFFVHGGAWGSGRPWMYRLCALPFLQQGWAVAIPAYRTYPNGRAPDQCRDVEAALTLMQQRFPQHCGHVTLLGHSSGAHIGLLLLAKWAKQVLMEPGKSVDNFPLVDAFVGLSGPYDISHHFDYEAARGVEELSPMKPSCGMTRQGFRLHSPALCILDALAVTSERNVAATLPAEMLLLHSIEDETVPFTSTAEAARVLRSCGVTQCQEYYVGPGTAHSDTVVQIMRGGPTRDAVIEWMCQPRKQRASAMLHRPSKL